MQTLTIRRPDDFHVHFRQGTMLRNVVPFTVQHFARALVMPNTDPPILNAGHVRAYREEIVAAVPDSARFQPHMTIKLTHATTPAVILAAKEADAIAAKLYPEGVTTNSTDGVRSVRALDKVFSAMEDCGMVLCIHGEVPGAFCLDREVFFLPTLDDLAQDFPRLKIVLEHVTSARAVEAVRQAPDNVAATITVHHLMLTLDDVVGDLLRPHHFCKPIAKSPADRDALLDAATSRNPKFFLGTDSAPHAKDRKECAEGCAGVYSAPVALPALATIFDGLDQLERLEDFTSRFGAEFYGLPLNEGTITLERGDFPVPRSCPGDVIPFLAGQTLPWRVAE